MSDTSCGIVMVRERRRWCGGGLLVGCNFDIFDNRTTLGSGRSPWPVHGAAHGLVPTLLQIFIQFCSLFMYLEVPTLLHLAKLDFRTPAGSNLTSDEINRTGEVIDRG
jgi:hypothetical protein